jgi:hypothetical protein
MPRWLNIRDERIVPPSLHTENVIGGATAGPRQQSKRYRGTGAVSVLDLHPCVMKGTSRSAILQVRVITIPLEVNSRIKAAFAVAMHEPALDQDMATRRACDLLGQLRRFFSDAKSDRDPRSATAADGSLLHRGPDASGSAFKIARHDLKRLQTYRLQAHRPMLAKAGERVAVNAPRANENSILPRAAKCEEPTSSIYDVGSS